MKKTFIIIIASLCFSIHSMGQAKKPTIMVVPATQWCKANNYIQKFDDQGSENIIPDYKLALESDFDLGYVISTINNLMQDRGYLLEDLAGAMNSAEMTAAEDGLTTSNSGAELLEDPIDKLVKAVRTDIILEVNWAVETVGPKKRIKYNLAAKDAYTNLQFAGDTGMGAPSFSADISTLLEEAVLSHMDNFTSRLQVYFDDILANGRFVTIEVGVFANGTNINLETEYNGEELIDIIDEWLDENTVSGRYNKAVSTAKTALYKQVRIPMYKPNGKAMDTEDFVKQLRSHLRNAPYGITCKVMPKGLGKAKLVIGDK